MTKKKQHKQQPHQISPEEYIKTKARMLPLYKCYINSFWIEYSFATIVVARQHPGGNFTSAIYFVDTFDKGVIKTASFFNRDRQFLDKLIENLIPTDSELAMVVEIDYALAHNIIFGAVDFAKTRGIAPVKVFEITKHLLEENNGKIDKIEIVFGKNEVRERRIAENDGVDKFTEDLI